jgi:hypothetical protein
MQYHFSPLLRLLRGNALVRDQSKRQRRSPLLSATSDETAMFSHSMTN